MITSEKQQPPEIDFVWSWERSKDPFHADAMPAGLEYAGTSGTRKSGWLGLDKWGNPVTFVPDGASVKDGKLQIEIQVVEPPPEAEDYNDSPRFDDEEWDKTDPNLCESCGGDLDVYQVCNDCDV